MSGPAVADRPVTGSGVTVRVVDPTDTDLVQACGALVADVYGGEELLEDEDGYLPVLREAGPRAREAVLLAAALDADLLGTATYARAGSPWAELARPGEAEMRMLAVSADARGRGVGRLLTLACLDLARQEGCTRFVLSSGPRMTNAHRMYEAMGFVRTPERDWSPVPTVDLVTYALPLQEQTAG
ncbi:GNAT family N-acetyltransferase [Aquipuribacter sp. MA13-6]|uniref:GNAT family N-acetyltransferase n=1 Tax=unclassified Aquipuribacter TaxID=2635084 RepID=UPI003EEE50AD